MLCSRHNAAASRSSYRYSKFKTTVKTQDTPPCSQSLLSTVPCKARTRIRKDACKSSTVILSIFIHNSPRGGGGINHREEADIIHFLQESEFYYLTGLSHPDSLALLHLPSLSTLPPPFLFHNLTHALEMVYAFTN